eukprot:scaffold151524_cov52-Attheya_sp.AAC.5
MSSEMDEAPSSSLQELRRRRRERQAEEEKQQENRLKNEKDSGTTEMEEDAVQIKDDEKTSQEKKTLSDPSLLGREGELLREGYSLTELGLLEESVFGAYKSLDDTLEQLRTRHLPTILAEPLSEELASCLYSPDTMLVGPNNETLAKGTSELMRLSSTFVTAQRAASRALQTFIATTSSFSSSSAETRRSMTAVSDYPTISYQLIMNPPPVISNNADMTTSKKNETRILVLWSVALPVLLTDFLQLGGGGGSSSTNAKTPFFWDAARQTLESATATRPFTGLSELTLRDARIVRHQVHALSLNNGTYIVPPSTWASSVAFLRRSVVLTNNVDTTRNNKDRPLSFASVLGEVSNVLNTISNLQQETNNNEDDGDDDTVLPPGSLVPLFLTGESLTTLLEDAKKTTSMDVSNMINVDSTLEEEEETAFGNNIPVFASRQWHQVYVPAHAAITTFVQSYLPSLVGSSGSQSSTGRRSPAMWQGMFDTDVQLVMAEDDTVLLRGSKRVQEYYQTLAALRKRSTMDFTIVSTDADWKTSTVTVSWRTTVNAGAAVVASLAQDVEGTDRFLLRMDNDQNCRIARIEQVELFVGGRPIREAEWVLALVRAVEGIGNGGFPTATVLSDVIQLIAAATGSNNKQPPTTLDSSSAKKKELKAKRGSTTTLPNEVMMSMEAKAAVYDIMCALQEDVPLLVVSPSNSNEQPFPSSSSSLFVSLPAPPAERFLDESIELRGLLKEELARGIGNYDRAVGFAAASLRAALGTGRVFLLTEGTKDPVQTRIELTSPSKIRVTLLLKLRVDPAAAALTPLFATATPQTTTPIARRAGGGLPLDTELVWEYRIDPSTGLIVQHSILEIRINGQPSPAEVVSGWFRKAVSVTERDGNQNGIRAVLEALAWARSFGQPPS